MVLFSQDVFLVCCAVPKITQAAVDYQTCPASQAFSGGDDSSSGDCDFDVTPQHLVAMQQLG
jgi:hypothetical protein